MSRAHFLDSACVWRLAMGLRGFVEMVSTSVLPAAAQSRYKTARDNTDKVQTLWTTMSKMSIVICCQLAYTHATAPLRSESSHLPDQHLHPSRSFGFLVVWAKTQRLG